MIEPNLIKGVSQIHRNYTTFFIDLWGVIHNGIQLNLEAVQVLENLDKVKKRIVLMSNAPRPSSSVANFLVNLKLNSKFLKNIFTSGDAAIHSINNNTHGKTFFHLGPQRDKDLFKKSKEKKRNNLENVDFILCTGLFDNKEQTLKYYRDFLRNHTRLIMVCTNPDLIVERGNKKEYCAGSVAKIFEKLGGKVIYYGKPYPAIYNFCIKKNEKILVIGDNLNTDIKGANNMNLDSLFITSGIHKKEFIKHKNIYKLLENYKVNINYYQNEFSWD